MKKFFSFLIVAFVVMFGFNLNVYALVGDVSIKSAEVVNKTGKTDVIKEPNFKGLTIDFGVRFFDVGDSVTYKIVVENKGSSDVYINDVTGNTNSEYFDYAFGFENEDKTVKAKSSKTFNLIVSYKNNIPDEKFSVSGRVVEKNEVVIKLGNEVEVKNPNTASSKYVMILVVLILVIVAFILFMARYGNKLDHLKQTNIKLVILFVVIGLVLYLGYSYAIEAVSINVNSIVEVDRKIERKARLARSCMSDSYIVDKGGFCIDWTKYVDYKNLVPQRQEEDNIVLNKVVEDKDAKIKSVVLLTTTSNIMEDNYVYNDITYRLSNTYDVSDIQNGEIILGVYADNNEENYLLIIGQYSGVLAPIDASSLFSGQIASYSYNLFTLPTKADFVNLDVSDTTNMAKMFLEVNYGILDLSMWDTSNVENISYMFSGSKFDSLNLAGFNTDKVTNMSATFYSTSIGSNELDLSSFNTSNVTDMSSMLSNCDAEHIIGLNNFNTSKVTNMNNMFGGSKAKQIDVSSFDTSAVTDIAYMFSFLNLNSLNVNNFVLKSTNNLQGLFCRSVINKLYISDLDTSNIQFMDAMFSYSEIDDVDLSNFDTSNVTDMSSMFSYSKLAKLDFSNFDTSNVTNMGSMFEGISIDTLDLSSFNTPNLNTSHWMFINANIRKLNLSNFNGSKLKDISWMFSSYGQNVLYPEIQLNSLVLNASVDMFYAFESINANVKIYTTQSTKNKIISNSRLTDDNFVVVGS